MAAYKVLIFSAVIQFYAASLYAQNLQLSVKDFGAVGDGVANDTLSVQHAVEFLTSKGGGVLYFPSGKYKALISISSNDIALKGDGFSSEIFWPLPVNGAVITFESPKPHNYKDGDIFVVLKNVGIEKVKITGTVYGSLTNGLGFSNCNNCFVRNIWIDSVNWKGLTFQNGSENIFVDNVLITNAALAGLTLEHSGEDVILKNIKVKHAGFQRDVPSYSRAGCLEVLQLTSGWVPEAAWKKISMSNVDVDGCGGDGVVIDIRSNFIASEFSLKNIKINNARNSGMYVSGGSKGNLLNFSIDAVKINHVGRAGLEIKNLKECRLLGVEIINFKDRDTVIYNSDCSREWISKRERG